MNKYTRYVTILWTLFIGGLYTLFLWSVLIRFNYLGAFGDMPDLVKLENPKNELASEVYSSDGVLLGKYFRENRSPVEYQEISPNVVNALITTEDIRFRDHSGIDLKGMFAIFYYMAKGDQRGSSTLTQQLAKNLFKTRGIKEKGVLGYIPGFNILIAKVKEWELAITLERMYTKNEIIALYLNTVDFGSNSFGIKVAAKTFFQTSQDSLTVPQAAMLIGLLKAPTLYSPILNPKNCFNRRNTVLELMFDNKMITQLQFNTLKMQPIKLNYEVENHNDGSATYFRTMVSKYLQEWCKKNDKDLYGDGLRIYTTIDSRMQTHAETSVAEHMKVLQRRFYKHWEGENPWRYQNKTEIPNFIEDVAKKTDRYKALVDKYGKGSDSIMIVMKTPVKMTVFSWDGDIDTVMSPYDSISYYKHILHTGFMTMDPYTGYIKTWVGGINYKYFKYDHVQQSKRQPGSSFKPFVYATAISQGISPCTLVPDLPITFEYEEDGKHIVWTPRNADWVYTGDSLNLRQGMARSINTIAARVTKMVGVDAVIDMAHNLGIESELRPVPSVCLGSSDVNVFEMVGAYSTFLNKGVWTEPTFIERIEDNSGNVIYEASPKRKDALSEEVAAVMVYMLKGGTEEGGGTSQALFQYDIFRGNEMGGKTGTSSNYSDGWFMGVSTRLVGGVWVGGEDRSIHFRTSATGEGSKTALPIFGLFMEKVYADTTLGIKVGRFKMPSRMHININCPRRPSRVVVDSLAIIEEEDQLPEEEIKE
jgi:penicillin-binding protein 1A